MPRHYVWPLVLVSAAFAFASAGSAKERSCTCKDLPAMERELFEQEWLQQEYYKYLIDKKPPTPAPGQSGADALNQEVIAAFSQWLNSPGGGGGGAAAALSMEWGSCSLISYKTVWVTPKKGPRVAKRKQIPFDEPKFREQNCKQVSDFLIAHERKHQEQCSKLHNATLLRQDPNSWMDSADFDVEAYGEGIKDLRKAIAAIASRCGWAGSTNATKKNPVRNKEVEVVPTLEEARQLAKALERVSKP